MKNVNNHIGSVMKVSAEMEHYNTALGAKWAHYINTRITLLNSCTTEGGGRIHLVKSPFAPETTIHFRTSRLGVAEPNEQEERMTKVSRTRMMSTDTREKSDADMLRSRSLLLEYL